MKNNLNSITHELRLALRTFSQHRSFTVLVLLALGIGIGSMTVVFSIVNVVLLRPLPVPDPDRLVTLALVRSGSMGSNLTRSQYEELKERNQDFEGMSAYQKRTATWQEDSRNRQIMSETVTGNYFSVLGVPVVLGRGLTERDDTPGADPVVVISHNFWNHHLQSEPGVLGKTLQIEGKAFTVVGVVGEPYNGMMPLVPTDFWLPSMSDDSIAESGGRDVKQHEEWWRGFCIIGRLNPGVSRGSAENNLRAIFTQLHSKTKEADRSKEGVRLLPSGRGTLPPHLQKGGWKVALSFLAMTSLVLLVACANVANLLLARAVARRKEIAIRLAMGASRGQLVRQLLLESFVVSLLAGGVGFAIAGWAGKALLSWEPLTHLAPLRLALELPMDFRVFVFALAVASVTSVLFGLAPALQATRSSVLPALTDDASIQPGRARLLGLRNLLLVAQVTFSVVLLIAAVMPLRGWWKQQRQIAEAGYHNLLLAPITLSDSLLHRTIEVHRRFLRELDDILKASPGIEKVAFTTIPPLAEGRSGMYGATVIDTDRGETTIPHVAVGTVSAGYFDAVHAPILQGRQFAPFDSESSAKVAIINEAFARSWPDRNPLGQRIRIQEQVLEICGVARTDWLRPGSDEALPAVFRPLSQHRAHGQIFLLARTMGAAAAHRQTVSSIILQLDPNALNLGGVRTAQEHREQEQWPTLVMARLMGSCSLLALALAAVGIYGVVNYNVTRRTREIGIRMALGARRGSILALVLRQVTILISLGIALGLILVWGIGQLAASMITIGRIANPLENAGIVAVLALVALISSLIPALKATKVNPLEALRHE